MIERIQVRIILSGYSEVTGNLIINNPTTPVTSLLGLEGLTSIGGNLNIRYTSPLTSLSGLDNLTSIAGYLRINSNSALTSLGLGSLCTVNGDFEIYDNTDLCENLAEDLEEQVDLCPGGGIGGTVNIHSNKTCP